MIHVENSWGVASVRQCAGFAGKQPKTFDCPLGACVVRWDISSKNRKRFFQSSRDLITVLTPSPTEDLVLAVSYSGELRIYNREYKVLLPTFALPCSNVIYGEWSKDGSRFALCSKGSLSMVVVYCISKDNDGTIKLVEEWRALAPQESSAKDSCDKLKSSDDMKTIPHQRRRGMSCRPSNDIPVGTAQKSYNCFDLGMFTEDGDYCLAILQQSEKNSEVYQFSSVGKIMKTKVISAFDDETAVVLCVSQCHKGMIALGLRRGMFVIMDTHTLENVSLIQAPGSPQACLWDADTLMTIGYTSNKVSWWSTKGVLVAECDGGPGDSVIFMAWEKPGVSLWIGGIMTLHYAEVYQTEKGAELMIMFSLKYHDVSGCGVDIDQNGMVVSGDLAGNVFQWSKTGDDFENTCNVNASVRCISAFAEGYFVGDLDGDLRCWKNDDLTKSPALMWSFGESVMNSRISKDSTRLLLGTGGGKAFMFKIKCSDKKIILLKEMEILTHEPQICLDAERGWENRSMEVWSVCWSPDETMFAAASEDYTTNVWLIGTREKVATLTGHTTAVTSVDWKVLTDGSTLFATCADDRTIRLSDGITFELQRIIQVDGIYGWYTLTYMAIDAVRDRLLCVTQNGFVAIWDCKSGKFLARDRMHSGSIEGLALSEDFSRFATISSDCVANRFIFN